MNMVNKIALTASILLFVLAQAFSCYVIYVGHQEKTELMREYGGNLFDRCTGEFMAQMSEIGSRAPVDERVATYFFRDTMPEGSALYRGEEELFNSSKYEFNAGRRRIRRSIRAMSGWRR